MNIVINKQEATLLAYSMDVMKNNCKERLRANLGIREGKKKFKIFKSVLQVLEDRLMIHQDEADDAVVIFDVTAEQSEVTREFIGEFTKLLADKAKKEGREAESDTFHAAMQNILSAFLIAEADDMAAMV